MPAEGAAARLLSSPAGTPVARPEKRFVDIVPKGRDIDLALILQLLDATFDLAQRVFTEAFDHSICSSKDFGFSVFQVEAPVTVLPQTQTLG